MRREAHANLQVCKKEKADKFANSKAQKIKLSCLREKEGTCTLQLKFCKKEKSHKLANGKLSFYDGPFYEQDSHHGLYHNMGPNGNCIKEPTFRFS
jgi:hypothetical protein